MGAMMSGDDVESDTETSGILCGTAFPPSPRYYRKSGMAYGRFNPPPLVAVVASIILLCTAFSGGWGFARISSGAYMLLVLLPLAAMMGRRRVSHVSLDASKHTIRLVYGIGIIRTTLPLRNVVGFVTPGASGGEDGKRIIYLQVRLRGGGKEQIPMGLYGPGDVRALCHETGAIVGRELPVTVAGAQQ